MTSAGVSPLLRPLAVRLAPSERGGHGLHREWHVQLHPQSCGVCSHLNFLTQSSLAFFFRRAPRAAPLLVASQRHPGAVPAFPARPRTLVRARLVAAHTNTLGR